MHRKLFLNLAVEDLERSVEFFTRLGFDFDEVFTDETATCMLVGEDAYVMLMTRERFADYAEKPYADPAQRTQAFVAVSAESRDEVNALFAAALEAGAETAGAAQELAFMYSRGFLDPDGHQWELVWLDPSAIQERTGAAIAP